MKPKNFCVRFYILEGVNIICDSEDPPDLYLKIFALGEENDLLESTLRTGLNP